MLGFMMTLFVVWDVITRCCSYFVWHLIYRLDMTIKKISESKELVGNYFAVGFVLFLNENSSKG